MLIRALLEMSRIDTQATECDCIVPVAIYIQRLSMRGHGFRGVLVK